MRLIFWDDLPTQNGSVEPDDYDGIDLENLQERSNSKELLKLNLLVAFDLYFYHKIVNKFKLKITYRFEALDGRGNQE